MVYTLPGMEKGTTFEKLPIPLEESRVPESHLEIPEKEFRGRLERIKTQMEERDLKALIVYSSIPHICMAAGNVPYIAGWPCRRSDTWLIVPMQRDPVLFNATSPYGCAANTWITDIRVASNAAPGPAIRDVLSEFGISSSVGGVGLENAPYRAWLSIREAMPDIQIKFVTELIYEMRAIKSPIEIEMCRKAARRADEMYEALRDSARPGEWGVKIRAKMKFAAERLGSEFTYLGFAFGQPAFFAHGFEPQEAWRKLKEGDQIISNVYATYQGYWGGHAIRMFNIGTPPQEVRHLAEAALEAEKKVIKMMKPGNTVAQLDEAYERVLEEYDLSRGRVRLGHGVGLDYAESPVEGFKDIRTQMAGRPPKDVSLKAGMVVAIHTNLLWPSIPAPRLEKPRASIGDTILMTETGPEILTRFPRELMEL